MTQLFANRAGKNARPHRQVAPVAAVLRENRARRKPLKTILQVVGCNQDEIPAAVPQPADLIMDPSLDEDETLRKIKAVLEEQRSSSL